jgi:hypothetical protein
VRVGSEETVVEGTHDDGEQLEGASVPVFITGVSDFKVFRAGCCDIDGLACKGDPDGVSDGVLDGEVVGVLDGEVVGVLEGEELGVTEGEEVGVTEGEAVGISEGEGLGFTEGGRGRLVGTGNVGFLVGLDVVGALVGLPLLLDGLKVGL